MKFTLSWLKDHLETDATLAEICERLTMIGLEVESVDDRAVFSRFRIARVSECRAASGRRQAAGAERRRRSRGQRRQAAAGGVWRAQRAGRDGRRPGTPGTYVPGIDTTLSIGRIRGVESHGMMCSERELELSDSHDGIIDLAADAPVGTRFADYADLADPVIEINLTPNRPDATGVAGIARDLAASGIGTLKTAAPERIEGEGDCPVGLTVESATCPGFALRKVSGVSNGASPEWMQKRLKAIGLRPINALVDITNYVTFDRGRPLHVFDAAKVAGDLVVRDARDGEEVLALDERTYTLATGMCVIADDNGVESIAGIMGGEHSGCDAATTDVLIESALWDPRAIARTGRSLGIITDARYRFERGVDPGIHGAGPRSGDAPRARSVRRHAVAPEGRRSTTPAPEPIVLPFAETERLTGIEVDRDGQVAILESLGFAVSRPARAPGSSSRAGGRTSTARPIWSRKSCGSRASTRSRRSRCPRPAPSTQDSHRAADPRPRRPAGAGGPRHGGDGDLQLHPRRACRGLRRRDSGAEAGEPDLGRHVGHAAVAAARPDRGRRPQRRPRLWRHGTVRSGGNLRLGRAGRPAARRRRAFAAAPRACRAPAARGASACEPVGVYDAKADAIAALEAAGAPVDRLMIEAPASDWYHPGRSGRIKLGPKVVLAEFGEFHPKTLKTLDASGPHCGFEVFLDAIPTPKSKATRTKPVLSLSSFQPVRRDFAFVVVADVEALKLVRAAEGADSKLVGEVRVFDVFSGAALGEGRKSVALEVTLDPVERTLTEEDLEAVSAKIVAQVEKATGGTLRS